MGIQDKIRDELYGSAEDELKSEREAAALGELTDTSQLPFVVEKRLAICLLLEAAGLAFIFFFPRVAGSYFARVPHIVVIGWFVLGFVIGFAAYTVLRTEVLPENDVSIDSGVMSGYSAYESRQRQFSVYLAGAAGGVVNLVIFFILLSVWF